VGPKDRLYLHYLYLDAVMYVVPSLIGPVKLTLINFVQNAQIPRKTGNFFDQRNDLLASVELCFMAVILSVCYTVSKI